MNRRALLLRAAMIVALLGGMPGVLAGDVCLIVNGLGGLPEYEENFVEWSGKLEKLFRDELGDQVFRYDGRQQGRDEILAGFGEAARSLQPDGNMWLFLVGHANHDGERFKFHIKGPDLTDGDLRQFLDGLLERRAYVIAATSASGALLPDLAGENRVIVTATKNRMERQPPLFLSFFLEAASSAEADTDKNGRVSLLEAFLFSRQKVASWFQDKGRIQTEHALLDDRGKVSIGGEKEGKSPNIATGEGMLSASASLSKPPEKAYQTLEANALAKERLEVEREIEDLKFRKAEMPANDYYRALEELLVKLATINEKIEKLEGSS